MPSVPCEWVISESEGRREEGVLDRACPADVDTSGNDLLGVGGMGIDAASISLSS